MRTACGLGYLFNITLRGNNMALYPIFENFITTILGQDVAVSTQGKIFIMYGSFIGCAFILWLLFKLAKWLIFKAFR